MKKRGRALALLLAAVLTVSSVPGTVMAADGVKPHKTEQRKNSHSGVEREEVQGLEFRVLYLLMTAHW